MFAKRQLYQMIVPLFLEQLLVMLVGIVDTVVVSHCGEAAVSGVSLVNAFQTIFIYLFTALASGGAVVVSQWIGRKDPARASLSISQLLMISTLFSLSMMLLILLAGPWILRILFGAVEADVMDACMVYLRITACSYPCLAIYNAGAALYRSMAKTKTTMWLSLAANGINVAGNLIGVFVLHAGVAGVAWPSLVSRFFCALVITGLCFLDHGGLHYNWKDIACWNGPVLRDLLRIAVPNGLESGLFQFVKVSLSSMAALFGTYQIAANGIAQSIWSLAALVNVAMGPVFITVIGQSIGAGDVSEANRMFRTLLRITVRFAVLWNVLVFACTPLILRLYAVGEETRALVLVMVLIHNIFAGLVQPFADPLGRGLRAAGDIRFASIVSILANTGLRLVLSWVLAMQMGMGVMGITWAMVVSWCVLALCFVVRWKQGTWSRFQVLQTA